MEIIREHKPWYNEERVAIKNSVILTRWVA